MRSGSQARYSVALYVSSAKEMPAREIRRKKKYEFKATGLYTHILTANITDSVSRCIYSSFHPQGPFLQCGLGYCHTNKASSLCTVKAIDMSYIPSGHIFGCFRSGSPYFRLHIHPFSSPIHVSLLLYSVSLCFLDKVNVKLWVFRHKRPILNLFPFL